ncbi:putative transcriptional regulator [Archaeoglobus sulfaticallidus PM70-1]|uniref:Putative transcriptional regulator n=1 Tax=Archaeoglobus sulfaticallidus PM70-1 TaxID=387631 RepID=N0BGC3_9EURY|nr:helix-turn-helix domain-containing protein [Archaeoglobus sulfaticallidus]AGK62028.1 putative transcriptional regulator [Archaeoglobus sulfaticallidus PM70-1]
MEVASILEKLGLSSYQAKALISLLKCGEAKASEISELSGVPRAKIYEVLDQLADLGLVDKIPSRPVKFRVREPKEILERLKSNIMIEYESRIDFFDRVKEELIRSFASLYSPASFRTKELIRVVSVGEASERETRLMYREAEKEINIVSRCFEYYPKVRKELVDAFNRGVKIKILLLGRKFIDERGMKVQNEVLKMIKSDMGAEVKLSRTPLPLRGSIVDPSYEYKTGKAIFVVEDPETPLYLRDSAVTDNPSLVAGMKKYFDLIWMYEAGDVE